MMLAQAEVSSAAVIRTFANDSPYLFLGSVFVGVGVIAAGFTALRRKFDPLFIYFALFAVLYGFRMWVQADLTAFALSHWWFYPRLHDAINYLVPLPAFLFFGSAGLLHRSGQLVGYAVAFAGAGLAVVAFGWGPSNTLGLINNVVVIGALLVLVVNFFMRRGGWDSDFVIVRTGLLIFAALALFDNTRGALSFRFPTIEPIGFAVFLASLGYVAGRRSLQRDHELSEIQKELEVAKRIQLSILPADFPATPHFRVAARYVPMTSVAGDFYDYVVTDQKQAGLLIADVSGHGVPAALIASMVKLAAASQREHAAEPGKFLGAMNAALCGNTQNQFVTAAYAHLDSAAGELRYSAAGHPPMLLARGDSVTEVEENGLMLAAFDFATYTVRSLPLRQGDRVVLYTDGIIEAADGSDEFFGRKRLADLLAQSALLSPGEVADRILSSVRRWTVRQDDDFTVIVCDYVQ
jgi:sigma-B regulation protein RsbU (phosphoserine phosphatase)